ncbi:integrase [Paraburkholderia bannensis]|uniref:Integrase n=1 Tax=Paraburkholderia bannensis TaxID=765414 RepID=A0A7W9WSM0_9BURK|nr:integrase [Paraburkholderia sp. WP4_3_2]MBB6102386.1 integrase [Paraburkholderia bannensis]
MRGATWNELDLDGGIWTVPGERMKANVLHRVSLSLAAHDIVKTLKSSTRRLCFLRCAGTYRPI